jgi:DNA repair exonuclease SbcCD nuclease subunit
MRDPAMAEMVGNATRRVFTGIVDLCLEERVDALLISGDLYDGDQTSMKTARFLREQIRRVDEAGIKVFKIRGNHDALSRITKELTFPESVVIFGARAGAIQLPRPPGEVPVVIHGVSFKDVYAPENLLPKFKPPVAGAVNIGLLHTSLDGALGHDPYAPCSLAELQGAGFRYWALGHIHKRMAVDGAATVVMPGMPQGRDINEAGAKSVTLVTVTDDGSILMEERRTSIAQFERVPVDLTGIEDWRDMVGLLGRSLGQCRDLIPSEHLVARVQFTGTTPLSWRLRRDIDLLRAEAADQAATFGNVWIDKVEVTCQPPGAVANHDDPPEADPVEELRRLMGEITQDDAYRAEIAQIAEELRSQLPPECRGMLGLDDAQFAARVMEAARDGVDDVVARLKSASGSAEMG